MKLTILREGRHTKFRTMQNRYICVNCCVPYSNGNSSFFVISVVVPKCFIKHMCFIVLYFHGHAFFSQEIAKKCFFVLYFLKNVLYFCKLFKWVEYLFQVFIYNTKIGEL